MTATVNPEGIAFYNRLIDTLLSRGIIIVKPVISFEIFLVMVSYMMRIWKLIFERLGVWVRY